VPSTAMILPVRLEDGKSDDRESGEQDHGKCEHSRTEVVFPPRVPPRFDPVE
jgi:hypothetical protein